MGELLRIPSPIDVHVHLREPGGEAKETIASGTRAALYGGYQAVFDMPNNPGVPTWTEERLLEKQYIARRDSRVDIGFYAGIDLTNPDLDQIPLMIGRTAGLKLYMDHTTGNVQKHGLDAARPVIDRWIHEARQQGLHAPILLHAREEVGAETAKYIAKNEHFVHWCHLSTATEAIYAARLTKRSGEYFTAGVTPHHLTMTERNADFQQGWNGARMQPPLAKEVDADALLYAYNKEAIPILETDHAPHTTVDKLKAETENPEGHTELDCTTCFGVSGIEFVLPVMTALARRKKITIDRLIDSLYDQPLRMLGFKAAQMASETWLNEEPYVIGENDIAGMSHNTPYIGWTGGARVVTSDMMLSQPKVLQAQPRAA